MEENKVATGLIEAFRKEKMVFLSHKSINKFLCKFFLERQKRVIMILHVSLGNLIVYLSELLKFISTGYSHDIVCFGCELLENGTINPALILNLKNDNKQKHICKSAKIRPINQLTVNISVELQIIINTN